MDGGAEFLRTPSEYPSSDPPEADREEKLRRDLTRSGRHPRIAEPNPLHSWNLWKSAESSRTSELSGTQRTPEMAGNLGKFSDLPQQWILQGCSMRWSVRFRAVVLEPPRSPVCQWLGSSLLCVFSSAWITRARQCSGLLCIFPFQNVASLLPEACNTVEATSDLPRPWTAVSTLSTLERRRNHPVTEPFRRRLHCPQKNSMLSACTCRVHTLDHGTTKVVAITLEWLDQFASVMRAPRFLVGTCRSWEF